MNTMFWGLRLEPGKRYSTTVDKSFHVSMAALDCSSVKGDDVLSVMLEEDKAKVPYILCNLHKQKAMQAKLDLNFMTGDNVTFFCKGNGEVHLSGYIVPDDEFDPLGDEEGEEEAEEEESNPQEISKKRRILDISSKSKKKKKVECNEADLEDSDVGEEEDEAGDLDEMDEESDVVEDEEDSDESYEEAWESEGEADVKVQQKSKKDKKKKETMTTPNTKQQQSPGKTSNGLSTPHQQQSGKKDKKKVAESPAGTPKGNKPGAEESSPQKKTLEGGVMIKDLRIGSGPACKPGKMATVYYTGRLKSNNKVFDSAMQGPGFKFKLGRGEVIKGWDIGVAGMKVGGKRTITCPPAMAYGAKGSPPTIPGNSTLVFEVELKSTN